MARRSTSTLTADAIRSAVDGALKDVERNRPTSTPAVVLECLLDIEHALRAGVTLQRIADDIGMSRAMLKLQIQRARYLRAGLTQSGKPRKRPSPPAGYDAVSPGARSAMLAAPAPPAMSDTTSAARPSRFYRSPAAQAAMDEALRVGKKLSAIDGDKFHNIDENTVPTAK